MCNLCVEWEKGKLTAKEAMGAIGELIASGKDKEHLVELSERILDKEVPISENDDELNKSWYEETHED